MKSHVSDAKPEIEAKLALKKTFLRAALVVAGGMHSSPEATRVAGEEASKLKSEIQTLESQLQAAA